ncbi:PEP-CTERM sorting domain-containing protein [Brasilonema sp. UFV-L1]|uniref:PEP-CTERM sorting domain-containing protein n=1 Tax=Brasilonema sp. UFV-L1 TaxID=2234130 RepID=UPI00145CBE1E|nr:PEP-CTERM sorting domain-containing protein [Brasilonema sp. UFV-L1]
MLRSHLAWLIPVALTFSSFGLNVQSASAQATDNTYDFTVNYETLVEFQPFLPEQNIVRATITGENTDAPYGLTNFTSNTYGQSEPRGNNTFTRFNSDPSVFGITGEVLGDRYYGSGLNQLFGLANDSAEVNPIEGTIKGAGTITITGGTGIFQNVTGKIDFTQNDKLSLDGTPSKGLATLKFSLKTPRTVPEPTATTTLIGLGVLGAGFVLRKHHRKKTFN